jgi:hypothetical protein
MQFAWQSGLEQMGDKTNHEMLIILLESNLKVLKLAEKSLKAEQEAITYSLLQGIMTVGDVMMRSYNIPKA